MTEELLTDEEIERALMGLHDKGVIYCAKVIAGYQILKVQKARSPELREKIDKLLEGCRLGECPPNMNEAKCDGMKGHCPLCFADQIIALTETDAISYTKGVLDGRKQEGERIEKWFRDHSIGFWYSLTGGKAGSSVSARRVWQALKGEK